MISRLFNRPKYWKKFPLKWKLLDSFYEIIRPLFIKNIDLNEDYYCGWCCKPVLKRYIFCSVKCSDADEKDAEWLNKPFTKEEQEAIDTADTEEGEPW
jgi:hypothetical protein